MNPIPWAGPRVSSNLQHPLLDDIEVRPADQEAAARLLYRMGAWDLAGMVLEPG